jgi:hypothetical protein
MVVVIVLDPAGEHLQHGCVIWFGLDPGVVAFEGFDEGLADPIALRASPWGEAGHEDQSGVGGAVISEPLNRMARPGGGEPSFDAGASGHAPSRR